jgi:hypothetical protein
LLTNRQNTLAYFAVASLKARKKVLKTLSPVSDEFQFFEDALKLTIRAALDGIKLFRRVRGKKGKFQLQ